MEKINVTPAIFILAIAFACFGVIIGLILGFQVWAGEQAIEIYENERKDWSCRVIVSCPEQMEGVCYEWFPITETHNPSGHYASFWVGLEELPLLVEYCVPNPISQ